MKALRSTLLVAVAICFCFGNAGQDVKAAIVSSYTKMSKAMMAKDMKTYFAFMTPDYKEKRPDRLLSLGYVRDDITRYILSLKTVTVKRDIKSVQASGNAAVAETGFKITGTFQSPGDKRVNKHETIQTTRDTWVKTAKGWQMKNCTVTKLTVLLNGKPLTGSGMGG